MLTTKTLNIEREAIDMFQNINVKQQLLRTWSIDAYYRGSKLEATILGMAADILEQAE